MAKKKLKMTDTKVRAVVVGAILLAFIFALYFIFKEPDNIKCPKGQIINSSGKCGDDPNYCQRNSWKCTSSKCVLRKDGECRDCADPDEVYAKANPATIAFLKGEEQGFGVESPLLLSDVSEYTCQKRCKNDTECPDNGTCNFATFPDNLEIAGLKPKVCKYKPIWFGVPTASNKNSYYCADFKPGTQPRKGYNIPATGGYYTSLKECAMDKWTANDPKKATGFKVGDYKNNNCLPSPPPTKWTTADTPDPKLNAANSDCNTYPCTDSALGGWGSANPARQSDLYLYKKPQKDDGLGNYVDADESKVGTCFKTYKKNENGDEVATAPQVPDGNSECNIQTNEEKCRVAAYDDDSYTVPHCKWYPAGSCLRIPKKLNPPTIDFLDEAIIYDNDNLNNLSTGKRATKTDFPNFYGGKSYSPFNNYPKVLDYDPTISNCKHKLMAQGASEYEVASLCGNFDEGEEFNPLEFRRCAGVVSNNKPKSWFHTTMQPFFVKNFTSEQLINARNNPRKYKEVTHLSPSADSAPTSKDQAGNELECVQLKKESDGTLCDGSPECIQQAQKRCDETPDCNGFFYYTEKSNKGRWCPKSSYTPDDKNPLEPNGTFYHTDNDPNRYTATAVISLGSPNGEIGADGQNTNEFCARGASCAGKDGDAVKVFKDYNILGQTKDTTLFPVADTYCHGGCDVSEIKENNWCSAPKESNSKWSTSKNLKKVTMTNDTGIAKGRKPEDCFNNWYKDYSNACGN